MGIIRYGIYDKATMFLKEISGINEFVETGTYLGRTTEWAAGVFAHVSTIELSDQFFNQTSSRLAHLKNVTFILGDSREKLQSIVDQARNSIIFWLDAHWSGGDTAGMEDQCPLLDELKIIYSSEYEHIVMIDDARTYMLPPRKPNNIKQFPTISDILATVQPYEIFAVILDDVIYLIPNSLKDLAVGFFQDEAEISENRYLQLLHDAESLREIKNKSLKRKMKRLLSKVVRFK